MRFSGEGRVEEMGPGDRRNLACKRLRIKIILLSLHLRFVSNRGSRKLGAAHCKDLFSFLNSIIKYFASHEFCIFFFFLFQPSRKISSGFTYSFLFFLFFFCFLFRIYECEMKMIERYVAFYFEFNFESSVTGSRPKKTLIFYFRLNRRIREFIFIFLITEFWKFCPRHSTKATQFFLAVSHFKISIFILFAFNSPDNMIRCFSDEFLRFFWFNRSSITSSDSFTNQWLFRYVNAMTPLLLLLPYKNYKNKLRVNKRSILL